MLALFYYHYSPMSNSVHEDFMHASESYEELVELYGAMSKDMLAMCLPEDNRFLDPLLSEQEHKTHDPVKDGRIFSWYSIRPVT